MTAPVAVFAYNRDQVLRQTLERLARCSGAGQTHLHIFCDGPRDTRDVDLVHDTVRVARAALGFATVQVHVREKNRGLANSIIAGVTEMCARYGRVVVVEDDLHVAPRFLEWMNLGLANFEDDERVLSVSGHSFVTKRNSTQGYFLPTVTTWGWGTWAREWSSFSRGADMSLLRAREVRRAFDLDDSYPYSLMASRAIRGKIDAWGVFWAWNAFRQNKLSLFPPSSLVENVGAGVGATNMRYAPSVLNKGLVQDAMLGNFTLPANVTVDSKDLDRWRGAIRIPTWKMRLIRFWLTVDRSFGV